MRSPPARLARLIGPPRRTFAHSSWLVSWRRLLATCQAARVAVLSSSSCLFAHQAGRLKSGQKEMASSAEPAPVCLHLLAERAAHSLSGPFNQAAAAVEKFPASVLKGARQQANRLFAYSSPLRSLSKS